MSPLVNSFISLHVKDSPPVDKSKSLYSLGLNVFLWGLVTLTAAAVMMDDDEEDYLLVQQREVQLNVLVVNGQHREKSEHLVFSVASFTVKRKTLGSREIRSCRQSGLAKSHRYCAFSPHARGRETLLATGTCSRNSQTAEYRSTLQMSYLRVITM